MRKKNLVYERGRYRLVYNVHRSGSLRSPYFQIQWYDAAARRNRSKSTGTADREAAEQQLDALYLSKERGQAVCPSCGQAINGKRTYLLTEAIELYLAARSNRVSINAIRARLANVLKYVAATGLISTTCLSVDEDWVEGFRAWARRLPVAVGNGSERVRAPGIVPVPRQFVGLLNEADGFYVKVGSVRKAFEEMQRNLSLPGERQAGLKLIRRSIAQLARKRLGEADWIEGRQMLGHHRPTVSDNYAPSDPSYLSRAQAVTEEIIAEIIALAPLAFASSGKEKQLTSHSIKGDKS